MSVLCSSELASKAAEKASRLHNLNAEIDGPQCELALLRMRLCVAPSAADTCDGLHIPAREFRLLLRCTLGHFRAARTCAACKDALLATWGDHSLMCSCDGDRTGRHNAVREALFFIADAAADSPSLEQLSPFPDHTAALGPLPSRIGPRETVCDRRHCLLSAGRSSPPTSQR